MVIKVAFIVFFVGAALSRHVNIGDLDEEDQVLFRAAYETPYEYDYHEEAPVGKLDLIKDGMWAIKAKIKEMKAINKALAANMLSTKLKLKELIADKIAVKKIHHVDKKPAYNYEAPAPPQPSYQHYVAPQYSAPQYPAPHKPAPQYEAPQYTAPQYTAPQYPAPQYSAPQYSAPQYTAPQYSHDPYYGH